MGERRDREFSAEERIDARLARRALQGSGISLHEAAKLALQTRAPVANSSAPAVTIEAGIDGFLLRARRMRLREQTFDFYESKLRRFAQKFAGEHLDGVTRPQVVAWLQTMPVARVTAKGYLRAVHALYSWARSSEPPLCATNPAADLLKGFEEPRDDAEVMVLQAPEVAALLAAAGPYRAALVLMVFAGIRPHEVAGRRKPPLEWRHVDLPHRMIRVPAEIAKTRGARVLEELPPVVWAWLEGSPTTGPVSPGLSRQLIVRSWAALRPLRPELKRWPQDVLRHTAASYLLRLWKDIGRVSEIIGHEGRTHLLRQRYLAMMSDAQAKAIAELRPSGIP